MKISGPMLSIPLMVGALLSVSGCKPPEQPAPPPPTVTVAVPEVRDVIEYYEYTGNTEAVNAVDVRARVSGYLQSQNFTPATDVKEGDLLFVIQPDEYEIVKQSAEASVQASEAMREQQQSLYDKTKKAFDANAATNAELIEAKARLDQAKADVYGAQAALHDANLNLTYTQVKSPLSGRVGRELVDVGNLVGVGEPTILTTVVQMDPIYAYFDVSERIVLEYIARGQKGNVNEEDRTPKLEMARASDPAGDYPFTGEIDWVDNVVDQQTGTIRIRGVFDNKDGQLFPGLFIRARAPYDILKNAVVVREDAVGTDIGGKYVLTVGSDNIVKRASVTVGPKSGEGWRVILEGLAPDQRYIIKGLQKARAGMPVNAQTESSEPTGTEPGAPSVTPPAAADTTTEPAN